MRRRDRTLAALLVLAAIGCGTSEADLGATAFGTDSGRTSSEASTTSTTSTTTPEPGSSTDIEPMSTGGPSFDVPPVDLPVEVCPKDPVVPKPEFSYIWIPNSAEGTVSKIDTVAMVELGRYRTGPSDDGHPALTSVNLEGDLVIANYFGGLSMIRAQLEDCTDPDATSTGPSDVLPWRDGCVAWHVPTDYESWISVAWNSGRPNPATCAYEDAEVWLTGAPHRDGPLAALEVSVLDGDTGVVIESIEITTLPQPLWGITGSASDRDGGLWFMAPGNGLITHTLVHVDRETLAVQTWASPEGYALAGGFTIDEKQRMWACDHDLARFDPNDESWLILDEVGGGGRGCMADGMGRIWTTVWASEFDPTAGRLLAFDTDDTSMVVEHFLPYFPEGISHDYQGFVWTVVPDTAEAYRIDPDSGEFDVVAGVGGLHDYIGPFNDMTGWLLHSVASTPAG